MILGGVTPTTCSTESTYETPSGTANNIVFTFDNPYVCGQFANGDWWVNENSGGHVIITSITPTASGGSNGFEVNPSYTNKQAFESTAEVAYDADTLPSIAIVRRVLGGKDGQPSYTWSASTTVRRWPALDGVNVDAGTYNNTFGDGLWVWKKVHSQALNAWFIGLLRSDLAREKRIFLL